MNSTILDDVLDSIIQYEYNIDGMLVVRHGYIVYEANPSGFSLTRLHTIQSCTKSFTSTVVGIAIHEGYLDSVDEKIVDIYSNRTIENLDAMKANMTVEHCLTMSSGLEWHEIDIPYEEPENDLFAMYRSSDMYQYVLDRPMAHEPGTQWAYNSGTTELLGGVVEMTVGEPFLDFTREYLFEPLGIENFFWWNPRTNPQYGISGGLHLTMRDMAKLGYLFLNNGTWDDHEIVSEEWVRSASSPHYDALPGYDYGYQWWIQEGKNVYAATGHYEQKIYVDPYNDLIVVFTADIADEDPHPTDYLFRRIRRAVVSDDSIESLSTSTNIGNYDVTLLAISLLSIPVTLTIVIAYWFAKIRRKEP
jgi:CubicO group peptidase (beta-lactamase class C family)